MNTTNAHKLLRSKMARGEFRAGRTQDITPYLNDIITYGEMIDLVRITAGKSVRQYAPVILAALDQIFAQEHGSLPLINAYSADDEDYYYGAGAAVILSQALLVEHPHDITRLCVQASAVLV